MSNLIQRDKAVIWHPFTPFNAGPDPVPLVKGEGIYLYTEDGRKVIDAISSWWVNIHGHGNQIISEAIARQAQQMEHVIFANFTHEPAIKLAENVLSILPANQSKVFYSDDGSTAVEVGLKMAFQYWHNQGIKKTKVIAIEGAYHGDTFGSMSVGDRSIFVKPFSSLLFDVEYIPFPIEENGKESLARFKALVDSGEIASFIFEPLLQGAGGMRTYQAKWLDQLLEVAKAHQVICIADEVMTGFGRTGKLFASKYLKNQPDIFCLSKALTGGVLALGVTTCSDLIVDEFRSEDILKTFFHGHSFTANPVACAAANASFDLLMTAECEQNRIRINRQHMEFKSWLDDHPFVKNARCLGTMLSFEVAQKGDTSYFNEVRKQIFPYFMAQNILLRPLGNVIYILPPYIIKDEELAIVYNSIKGFLDHLHD